MKKAHLDRGLSTLGVLPLAGRTQYGEQDSLEGLGCLFSLGDPTHTLHFCGVPLAGPWGFSAAPWPLELGISRGLVCHCDSPQRACPAPVPAYPPRGFGLHCHPRHAEPKLWERHNGRQASWSLPDHDSGTPCALAQPGDRSDSVPLIWPFFLLQARHFRHVLHQRWVAWGGGY